MVSLLERYHQWRRGIFPATINDVAWRHEFIAERMEEVSRRAEHIAGYSDNISERIQNITERMERLERAFEARMEHLDYAILNTLPDLSDERPVNPPRARLPIHIDLSRLDSVAFLRTGWHEIEDFGRWTSDLWSTIILRLDELARGPLKITIELVRPAEEQAFVRINGVQTEPSPSNEQDGHILTWIANGYAIGLSMHLEIGCLALWRPSERGFTDNRALGLAVKSISIEQASTSFSIGSSASTPFAEAPSNAAHSTGRRTALFCKSFAPDLPRAKLLIESILRNNRSDLPLFVCTPRCDLELFKSAIPSSATLIAEEEFTDARCFTWLSSGWKQQQVVKMLFYRLDLCDQFLVLDSDSYFIREFSEEDIFGAPHETRIVASMSPYIFGISEPIVNLALGIGGDVRRQDLKMDFNPDRSLRVPRSFLKDKNYKNMPSEATLHMIPYAFSRLPTTAPHVHFLPSPVILSSEILRDFEQYVTDEGVTFTDLIHLSAWEADWYGYFCFKFSRGRITPIEPLFLHFNSDESLNEARKMGVSRNSLSKNFLGLTLAARQQSELQL
jgi:hypothetical protein